MAQDRATLVYRITHVANLRWLFTHGLHCANSAKLDPDFVSIGNPELIERRSVRHVPIAPGGTLDDYIPFYFCTHSLMLFNIHTGRNVQRVDQREIVYIVTSMEKLKATRAAFIFTDRHAYAVNANYCEATADLGLLDWELLRTRDFSRDPNRPDKLERRAAELLVHKQIDNSALLGVGCFDDATRATIEQWADISGFALPIRVRRSWYF